MAVALDWKGYVDTDLSFAEFFSASHTLVLRFMPQHPNAYEGLFIAEKGTGTFGVGQGYFGNGTDGSTKLYLAVGTEAITPAAPLKINKWHHLAVVVTVSKTLRTFALYLDGTQLGTTLQVALNAAQMPVGTLRFGRRTTGQTVNGRDAQAFGLLDDIAIFTSALSASQIQFLRDNVLHLTGNESNLLAGYTFAEGQLPSKLARPVTLNAGARRVTASAKRDSAIDAGLLPLPTWHQAMDLPFPVGEPWKVVNGFETPGAHHVGYAAFCWDLVLADQPDLVLPDRTIESGGEYPKGTGGAPLHASAPGKAVTVVENQLDGTGTAGNGTVPNILEIEQAPGEIAFYEHLRTSSVTVNVNDKVLLGQKVALAGASGMKPCDHCNHLHFTVTNKPDQTPGFITLPVAFRDYEVRGANNTWQSVARGIPVAGQVIRNPPTPMFGAQGLQTGNAIAHGTNLLDLVATDTSGRVWAARWAPSSYAGNWDRWRPVLTDIGAPSTPVKVVARDASRLDVFVAGNDGKTYTAACDQNVDNAQWRGWWNILAGAVPTGGVVTAVARDPGKLDLFIVSTDGGIYTAAWDQNVASAQWRGWWRVGNLVAKPGSPVAAVARDATKMDIFVVGNDGKTYTAAWDQNVANAQWRGWWNILTGAVPAGGAVTAVARDPGKLDLFIVSTDGGIYTAAWDQNVASAQWRGWWRVGNLVAKPGSPVAAVARDATKMDIFVAGNDGKTYAAAWDPKVAGGQWSGWLNILTGAIAPGSPVTAVSRDTTKLDIFIVSTDGGIYTAAWDQNVANAQWRGWWRIGG